jgi:dihydrodipicolinate synthase/N-acetylneuraminate lyase
MPQPNHSDNPLFSAFPRGVLPVLQTPFNEDGSLDKVILQKEIDWLFSHRVDGVTLAMVSEITKMGEAERRELLEATVQSVAGRGPVIASVGAESTPTMLQIARHAEQAGACALMAVPPALTRQSSDQVLEYYRALFQATNVPVIIQDASGYLGSSIPVETLALLHDEFTGRAAFKPEAPPLAQNHEQLMTLTDGTSAVYEGTAGIGLWGGFRRGVIGTMPGSDVPWAIRRLWDLLAAGKREEALEIHALLCALVQHMQTLDSYLCLEKRFLVQQQVFRNTLVRQPNSFEADEITSREIDDLFLALHQRVCGEKSQTKATP